MKPGNLYKFDNLAVYVRFSNKEQIKNEPKKLKKQKNKLKRYYKKTKNNRVPNIFLNNKEGK